MPSRSIYLWLVVAAAIAALFSWQAVALTYPVVPTPEELIGLTQPTQAQIEQARTLQRTNDTYALMIFGALCVVGGAPLFLRGLRLPLRIVAILAAVGLGTLTGAAMGGIGFSLDQSMPIKWDALVRVALRWMAMLAPTGIVAALITVVCQRAWGKSFVIFTGGVIGSIFAALAYSLIVALLFQTENSDSVLPFGTGSRLLLFVLAPLFIWSTIAHQEASESTASPAGSLPTELEAA